MSKSNLLSVIVPIYNAQEWIYETLDSLCAQNYSNMEILCIDDGSGDKSIEILKEYQNKDSCIRLFQQENAGVSAARNHGIDEARGEYIAFIDADDCVEPCAYAEMISLLEQEQSDIVFGQFSRFWPNGKIQYTIETSLEGLEKNPGDIKYFLLSSHSETFDDHLYTPDIHGSACRSIFKKEIISQNGIRFHQDLTFAEDQIFVLEYLAKCKRISYFPKTAIRYRGWTKPWVYRCLFDNMMNLCRYQCDVLKNNDFYSEKQRNHLIGYCKYSAFLTIINQEFMFRSDADQVLKEYYKNKQFVKLNSFYNFRQKQSTTKDFKRVILFVLLKLRLFSIVKRIFPYKKY